MEDWGEEIFAEGVGVKWKNERVGRGRERMPQHLITIKDGGIKSLIYLEFRSKITPALQAIGDRKSEYLEMRRTYAV